MRSQPAGYPNATSAFGKQSPKQHWTNSGSSDRRVWFPLWFRTSCFQPASQFGSIWPVRYLYNRLKTDMQMLGTPSSASDCQRAMCSTESNAFRKSIAHIHNGELYSKDCPTSWATVNKWSSHLKPLRKPAWSTDWVLSKACLMRVSSIRAKSFV